MAKKPIEISETKIRQAIWMQKAGKTKKSICEHLNIAYNTKRLDTIIQDFKNKEVRVEELKKKARAKSLTESDKEGIIKSYQDGESQSAIAKQLYLTPQRVKTVLIEKGIPIRARKKKGQATVDHVIQDLDVKFKKEERVFIPSINSFAKVKEVLDEDWVEYHSQPRRRKYVELHGLKEARKKWGEDYEGKEDVHWNIYWEYDSGGEWKEFAIKDMINKVETIIEETGREYYRLYVEGDYGHFRTEMRSNLYPVRSSA